MAISLALMRSRPERVGASLTLVTVMVTAMLSSMSGTVSATGSPPAFMRSLTLTVSEYLFGTVSKSSAAFVSIWPEEALIAKEAAPAPASE